MSIFNRLETLLRSEWNAAQGGSTRSELRDAVADGRAALARLSAEEEFLTRRIEQARSEVRYRQETAERAVKRNDDAGARDALRQKLREQDRLDALEREWQRLRRYVDELSDTLRSAETHGRSPREHDDVQDTSSTQPRHSYYRSLSQQGSSGIRRGSDAAREQSDTRSRGRADSSAIGPPTFSTEMESGGGLSTGGLSDPFNRFDELEERIERSEAMAEAESDISAPSGSRRELADNELEQTFRRMERERSLTDLKKREGARTQDEQDPLARLRNRMKDED